MNLSKPLCLDGQREYRMCRKKKKFATAAEAQKAHAVHRPYRCPLCKHWHLASPK